MSLRAYQQRAVDDAFAARGGVIEAPTGSGKTHIGLELIRRHGLPALVLVHTKELEAQWVRAGASLRAQRADYRRAPHNTVEVATVQALYTRRKKLRVWAHGVRCVIVDEAHHTGAETWQAVLAELRCPRYGLTATPRRHDGNDAPLQAHVGRTVAKVSSAQVERAGGILRPLVRWYATHWAPSGGDPRDELATDPDRNATVADLTLAQVRQGRRCLVIVDRVGHVDELVTRMGVRRRVKVAALHGQLGAEERRGVIERFQRDQLDIIVATPLVDEGLDLPELDTVILATPTAAQGRTQQRIGRILRPGKAKQAPVVWDLVDAGAMWADAARAREQLYTQRGWAQEAITRRIR